MDIPALDAMGELDWQLHHNDDGYYECAKGFHAFVEELDDVDVDFENIDSVDPDTLRDEFTREEIYALAAFNYIALEYVSLFQEDADSAEDLMTDTSAMPGDGGTMTLSEHLDM